MSNLTFPDFTLEASPSLTDFVVGYRTNIAGGERRTTLQSVSDLLGTGYFGSLTANRLLLGQANGTLASSDLTYSTPTLTTPDGFNISSAGSIFNTPISTGKVIDTLNTGYTAAMAPFAGHVVVGPSATEFGYLADGFGDGTTVRFVGRLSGGTPASPTAVATGRVMVSLSGRAYDGSAYSGSAIGLSLNTAEAWSGSARGTMATFFYTPRGTTATKNAFFVNASLGGIFRIGDPTVTTDLPDQSGIGFLLNSGASVTIRNTTSSGTVAFATGNSFNVPTFSASSATTYTNAANLYIAGDVASGTNVTLTNSYGLWNVGKTRLDGAVLTASSITTGAPSGGTAAAWKFGTVSVTSPTSPNRTIELDVAGTRYFLAAKTTNN